MSLLLLGLYPRLWTVLNYVLAVKLTCGFTGSEGSIIVCTDLDPCLGVSGMELGTRPACSGWICLDFFFLPVLQRCRSARSFQFPCATYHCMNWAVLCVCMTGAGTESLSLTSACSASVLFCPPQHPKGSLVLPLLACPTLPVWDLPLSVWKWPWHWGWHSLYCG